MVKEGTTADPGLCPLCRQNNNCAMVSKEKIENCWCFDSGIEFTEELLEQVAIEARGKSCLCKTCAESYSENVGVIIQEVT